MILFQFWNKLSSVVAGGTRRVGRQLMELSPTSSSGHFVTSVRFSPM